MNKAQAKFLNKKLGWIFGDSPCDGEQYWCSCKRGIVFIATATEGASNGWSNGDTWEDFDNEVVAYQKLPIPPIFKPYE